MIVKKILNNNLLLVESNDGKEHIAMGKGLRFSNQVGQPLKEIDVEKMYILKDEKNTKNYLELLEKKPSEHAEVIQEAIQMANQKMNTTLNEQIFVTLFDHLIYALERCEKNIILQNRMLWEIQKFYPKEYLVASEVLAYLNRELDIELPQEEVGNIAFHIVNAQIDVGNQDYSVKNGMLMVKMLKDICQIIQLHYQCEIKEDSINYSRFIIHMQFFLQRLLEDKMLIHGDISIYESIIQNCKEEMKCVEKIKNYIKNLLGKEITKEESVYLVAHISRVIHFS